MELIFRWKFSYPLWITNREFQEKVGDYVADLAGIEGISSVTQEQKTYRTVTFECQSIMRDSELVNARILPVRMKHEA